MLIGLVSGPSLLIDLGGGGGGGGGGNLSCSVAAVPVSMQYLHHWQCVEAVCEDWARVLLSRAVFRAWQRATCTSRREGWEREMRAKIHHTRSAVFTHSLYMIHK